MFETSGLVYRLDCVNGIFSVRNIQGAETGLSCVWQCRSVFEEGGLLGVRDHTKAG